MKKVELKYSDKVYKLQEQLTISNTLYILIISDRVTDTREDCNLRKPPTGGFLCIHKDRII